MNFDDSTHPDIFEVPGTSPHFRTELAAQLAELIPEAVADGKLDIEKLRELLADDVADGNERFGLFWPGKKRALRAAQAPTTATLKPDFAHSKDWDTTQNVFIEGDNLEVLKTLQRHYHNKIKLIYIDPPYNTGKDFVYPDNFKEGLDTYLEWTRQVAPDGKPIMPKKNLETEGRYHSNWLNMMYPRLKLARNLLTDDGVIFISIDDNEVDSLRKLCNEIFGESNFFANVVWQKKYAVSADDPGIASMHDHILVYGKSSNFSRNLLPRTEKQTQRYTNLDNDPRGVWSSDNYVSNKSRQERPTLWYSIKHPKTGVDVWPEESAVWRYSQERHLQIERENRLYWGPDLSYKRPRIKRFLSEVQDGIVPSTWWTFQEVGHNDEGQKETAELLGPKIFSTPKPIRLLHRIIEIGCGKDALVMDFFSGSCATAHAVMARNAEDGGNRRFIMVQLPEPTPEESEARKAGFNTIADISRKRIELAGEKIKADSPMTTQELDTGFRAYKLADTNFSKWRVTSEVAVNELEQHLLDLRDSADDAAQADDLLTELLLKLGYSLIEPIHAETIAGLTVSKVGDNDVLAYLNEHAKPTLEQLRALVETAPARIIVLEDAFHGDDELKTNLAQFAKSRGIELWTA